MLPYSKFTFTPKPPEDNFLNWAVIFVTFAATVWLLMHGKGL